VGRNNMADIDRCETNLEIENEDIINNIMLYETHSEAAVGNLVGVPDRTKIEQYQEALKSTPKKDKRKIKVFQEKIRIEKRKHSQHEKLFDYLVNYFMESGSISNYEAIPSDMAEAWRHYFSKMLLGLVTPESIMQGSHRVQSIFGQVKKVVKARKKMMRNKKLSNFEVAVLTPDVIMMKADRFGIVSKVVNSILRVSDNETQMAARFTNRFKEVIDKYRYNLEQLIAGRTSEDRIVNINNAAMGGLVGFNIRDGAVFAADDYEAGQSVMIVGEVEKRNGIPQWQIRVKLSPDEVQKRKDAGELERADITEQDLEYSEEKFWLPKTELNQPEFDPLHKTGVYDALLKKYKEELLNDILSGQVRYFVPRVIPPRTEQGWWDEVKAGEEIFGEEQPNESNGKFIGRKKAEMARDKQYGEDNDTQRLTPGVHTVTKHGMDYTYIMKKLSEGDTDALEQGERYVVFLLNKQKIGEPETRVNFLEEGNEYTQAEINDIFTEGFYKATKEMGHGKIIKETTGDVLHGADRRFRNFNYMEEQPNRHAINDVKGGVSFWDTVYRYRGIYDDIFTDVEKRVQKFTAKMTKMHNMMRSELAAKGMTVDEIDDFFEEFEAIGGIRSKLWTSPDGSMWSINSFLQKRSRNYSPSMYSTQVLDEMIDAKIRELKLSRIDIESKEGVTEDEIQQVDDATSHLELIRDSILEDPDPESVNRLVNGERLVHMKHLTDWTDMTKRRKDGDVPYDYLKHTYMIIARNDLMVDAMESMYKLSKQEKNVPRGTMDYMINRLKMGVGDPDTRATGLFGTDRGHRKIANLLNNRVPKSLRLGMTFTPQSVEKLVKWIGAIPTMRFLGASSAVGNRTQIVNMIIAEGFGTWSQARKLLADPDFKETADKIIANTGVLNLLTMFKDIMLQDGELDFWDFGFYPGTIIPTKNMADFVRLLSKGRDAFIKGKDNDMTKFLQTLWKKSQGKTRDELAYLLTLEENRHKMNKDVEKKAGAFYDLLTSTEEESKNKALMEARFKKLVGQISESKLKKMVSWKLSYWWEGAGKKVFTFTAGEQQLRAETAMMAILGGYRRGLLGGVSDDIKGEDADIFMSDKAVKLARDAVYNTQFGMTPVYLGELFNGLGRAIWQYKSYPTQQMAHDYKVFQKFSLGSNSHSESVWRVIKAISKTTYNQADKWTGGLGKAVLGMERPTYDPKDEQLDHEALAVARLLFTRGVASTVASAASVVPLIPMILRVVGAQGFSWSLMRSAENPAFGMLARTLTWGTLMAMGADDDDKLEDLLGSAQYLLLPVWIGMLIRDGITAVEYAEWFSEL